MEFTYLDRWHYAVNKKRAWYSKFFIESERNLIIPELIQNEGFELIDNNQKETYKNYGDYFGYEVWIQKELSNSNILGLKFYRGDILEFYLYKPTSAIYTSFSINPTDEEWVKVEQIDYKTYVDYDRIVNIINMIINKAEMMAVNSAN